MLNPVTVAILEAIAAEMGHDIVRADDAAYLSEPRARWQGHGHVLAPRSTREVAAIVRRAAEARIGIVPYGGGTGLVGGQLTWSGPPPIVLSLERMAAIRDVLPLENVAVVEAGAILADVKAAVAEKGRLFPLSLASEGSARIGGLLATNAGGVNVLRYGNAREQVLGVEAVLPNGEVFNGLTRLRKDNTGYDLRNLLIGSEGTLGIITAATLRLKSPPAAENTAIFVVESPDAALSLLSLAREVIGGGISAFELIHRQGFDFLTDVLPQVRQPFETPPEWCVLIDVGLAQGLDPEAALGDLFEAAFAAGLVSDGLIAQSEGQRAEFWAVREQIPEANRLIGAVCSHDISLPLGAVAEFIARAPEGIARIGDFRINCFGHMGDGNLHYNVFPPRGGQRADHEDQRADITRVIHDLVHDLEGSISAEHGIGRLKVADLERYGDPAKLAAMCAIKAALDPLGIMNPGAVLRGETA